MNSHSPGLPATDKWRFDVRRAMGREAGWRRGLRQEWQHDFRMLSVDSALRAVSHYSASSSTFGSCLPSMSACFRFPPCTFHHSSEIQMHGRVHQGAQDGFFQQPSTLNFLALLIEHTERSKGHTIATKTKCRNARQAMNLTDVSACGSAQSL